MLYCTSCAALALIGATESRFVYSVWSAECTGRFFLLLQTASLLLEYCAWALTYPEGGWLSRDDYFYYIMLFSNDALCLIMLSRGDALYLNMLTILSPCLVSECYAPSHTSTSFLLFNSASTFNGAILAPPSEYSKRHRFIYGGGKVWVDKGAE